MKEFWREELSLFKKDIENLWDFMFQEEPTLALRPDENEIMAKAEAFANDGDTISEMDKASEGFWNREFELLKKDVENAWNFLFQPIDGPKNN